MLRGVAHHSGGKAAHRWESQMQHSSAQAGKQQHRLSVGAARLCDLALCLWGLKNTAYKGTVVSPCRRDPPISPPFSCRPKGAGSLP